MHIAAYKMLCAAEVAIAAAKDDTEPERNSLDAIRHLTTALVILLDEPTARMPLVPLKPGG